MVFFFVLGEIGFEPLGKFTAGKHDAASTTFTFQPNVRTKTRNSPLIGAAGMLFAQAQMIVESKIGQHNLDA
jgi:hypothetical protein